MWSRVWGRNGAAGAVAVVVVVLLAGHPLPAQARIGKFWHVTDFHYDLNYTTSGDINSMCWDTDDDSGDAGEYGDYLCDAPMSLITSAVDAMVKFESNPDFILWTGDDTAHVSDDHFSTSIVVDIVTNLTSLLDSRFPNTHFFPVLGNHDFFPKNQVPVGASSLQASVAGLWKPWFDRLRTDIYSDFKTRGWYWGDVPNSNVTVVALNTLIWYKSNNHTDLLPDYAAGALDPGNQFSWIDSLLTDLEERGRRVYIVGHIPPGTFERYQQETKGFHWYQPRYNEAFIQLIQEHADVIEAQFFAHHHTDSFRLFFDEDRVPVSYQLLAPGVTPWRSTLSEETGANNPGIRLISYDTDTGRVMDVHTYYLDLSAANQAGRAEWRLEYNFSSTYDLNELTPDTLYELAKELKDDRDTFNAYYSANTVSLEDPEVCEEQCRRLHWCAITEVDYDRFYSCNVAGRVAPVCAALSLLAPLLLALLPR